MGIAAKRYDPFPTVKLPPRYTDVSPGGTALAKSIKNRPKSVKPLLISIVAIAYNEEANLPEFFERVNAALPSEPKYEFEIILIDNCSTDATREKALALTAHDPRWKYIRFSRNFGAEASLAAGLHHADGDAVILLMSDLQDPPEKISEMLRLWQETDSDIVYGVVRVRNDENFVKSFGAKAAYWLIRTLSDVSIPANATDYRLLTKTVVQQLRIFPERVRYLRGLIHWLGFKQTSFEYDRASRKRGKSSANLLFCIGYALTAITSMSTKPLRLASLLGVTLTALTFLGAGIYGVSWLLHFSGYWTYGEIPQGWTTITLLIMGFAGLQFLFLGLLGEYLAQVFLEVKGRPRWIVEEAARIEQRTEKMAQDLPLRRAA